MRAIESLKRNPSASLLAVQLLGVLLYPLMEASPRGRALFNVFGLLSVASAISPRLELPALMAALEAVFYFYATGSLIAYMWQDTVATTDELFAAGATFTLLAWAQ